MSVASEACPPALDVPSTSRRSRARRVNTSMWRASSAHWIASTCSTSRKCGWICARNRAGTSNAAVSFSTRYVITCTIASSIASSCSMGASHGIAVVGSHCAAAACAYRLGAVGPHLVLMRECERDRRHTSLDQRTAGGEAPARIRDVGDRSGRGRIGQPRAYGLVRPRMHLRTDLDDRCDAVVVGDDLDDAVALRTAPHRQMDAELAIVAVHAHALASAASHQRPREQQIGAAIEPERAELDGGKLWIGVHHWPPTTPPTNASI